MSDEVIHIDFETRSPLPFGKAKEAVNVYVYAAHECTDLWCAQIAIGDDDPVLWTPYSSLPKAIENHMKAGAPRCAHNAQFERVIWNRICTPRYGWPETVVEHWDCTMSRALAMALPAGLDGAAAAMGLETRKDTDGHRLMMQMAKPRSINPLSGQIEWWDEEDKKRRLFDYCRQDVIVERELDKALFRLMPIERETYFLDQRMNDRGVFVDQAARKSAELIVNELTASADADMEAITKGAVQKISQVAALTGWINNRITETEMLASAAEGRMPELDDAYIEGLGADKIEEALARDDLPDDVVEALRIRQSAAKTSTAKLSAFERHADADGRVRGTLQYCGAGRTARWAGRGPQLQNLPRPSKEFEEVEAVERALSLMNAGDAQGFSLWFEEPLSVIADCLRGLIVAPHNRQFDCADFSNIEGRGLAWLVGEQWKLDAFRAFDAGKGPDLYLVAAGKTFGIPPEQAKPWRQIGKVEELALGYQGGPNAFATMAKTYGLKIGDHFDTVWDATAEHLRAESLEAWNDYGKTMRMDQRSWLAAEAIKRAWRAAHPATVEFWRDVEDAAKQAVFFPGSRVQCGKIEFRMAGSFLCCRLPSGRVIFYAYPEIRVKKTPWGVNKDTIFYKGVDGYTKRWCDQTTYGGKLTENIVQALARDLMRDAMLRLDKRYPIVMTVHDEIVSETPAGFGDHEEFRRAMAALPDWAGGFPMAVSGWRGERYRK